MQAEARYLRLLLEPFRPFLVNDDLTDLYVNKAGEVWTEHAGSRIERHDQPAIDERLLHRLARQIASFTHQGVSRAEPLLSAILPEGERVQMILPPATRSSTALAIRKAAALRVSLRSFEPSDADAIAAAGGRSHLRERLQRTLQKRGRTACLKEAVHTHANIVVSGGTSTGKTTFLNSLLAEVDMRERLIFVEDTPELHVQHANAVALVAVRGRTGETLVTSDELVTAALRLRPDRIILGELRGQEALAFLRAANTGHPGSMTTIHANDPASAVDQLILLIQHANISIPDHSLRRLVLNTVDAFVQLERRGSERVIQDLVVPDATSP